MKTFIVPTDFSAAAHHAALYAAELAKAVGASVRLLHVYQLPVTLNDFPVPLVSVEELKRHADEGLRRAMQEAQQVAQGVTFSTESRLGDVVHEINDVCTGQEVLALVTGTKDLGGFERFLLGNTTLSLVRNCLLPVIAVPEGASLRAPRNLALALDFFEGEEVPVQTINGLVQAFGARLQLVHVEEDRRELTAADVPAGLQYTALHSLKEEEVTEGIRQFVAANGIDLVLVLPHKHNFYERLFFKGHTAGLIQAMPVPVMSVHGAS